MKAMTSQEARKWCSQDATDLTVSRDGTLRYKQSKQHRFYITAPEEHREIIYLAYAMAAFRGEAHFSGGFIWLQRWYIGSPQLVRTGWRILEDMRRARGELRSLEVAPAQFFREDELVELHVFLIQAIAYGWVTDYVPCAGRFFLHFKDNRQICITAQAPDTLSELRTTFERWNPTDEDPMVVKLRLMEKAHKKK